MLYHRRRYQSDRPRPGDGDAEFLQSWSGPLPYWPAAFTAAILLAWLTLRTHSTKTPGP